MALWHNLNLILVGILWGVTNPFIRRGTTGVDKVPTISGLPKILTEIKFLITRWQYIVPFLINQCGSVLYVYTLQHAHLSVAVPVANSCTFLFTALTAMLLGEQKHNTMTYVGIALVATGISICMSEQLM